MSQVYATEPQTTGRVILETSHGPLDINLWCKECPTTTRMFLQLCLDGYYDSIVFHRIMENFLVQAGQVKFVGDSGGRNGDGATRDIASGADMKRYLLNQASSADTAAAVAADESWSNRRKLEVSPRIRFNHRGQVAMALPLDEDVEGNASADALRSQFFITLDESSFLDGKHVIFGTITGPTVFNAIRIGKVAVEDDTSRPVDMDLSPPIIKRVKIDHHPFHDLVPTPDEKVPWKRADGAGSAKEGSGEAGGESQIQKRRKKRKGKRDLNVLSFGQEMEDDDGGIGGAGTSAGTGMRSSHDVLASESKFLSSSIDEGVREATTEEGDQPRTKKKRRKEERRSEVTSRNIPDAKVASSGHRHTDWDGFEQASQGTDHKDHHQPKYDDDFDINSRKEKSADKRSGEKTENNVSAVEARRAKYLKGNESRRSGDKFKSRNEEDTLKKLSLFKSKMLQSKGKPGSSSSGGVFDVKAADNSLAARMAKRSMEEQQESKNNREESVTPTYHGQVLEGDDDDDSGADESSGGWMKTKFKCRKHIDHGAKIDEAGDGQKAEDGRKIDDYEVLEGGADRGNGRRSGKHHRGKHHGDGSRKGRDGGDDGGQHRHHRRHHHHHHHERSNGGHRR
jgi:peptidyl-prolyl cis-trans isomerase SDCCAG10